MNIKYLGLTIVSLFLISSCSNGISLPFTGCKPPVSTPIISADKLLSYPEEIYLDDNKYYLNATLTQSGLHRDLYLAIVNPSLGVNIFMPNRYRYDFIWLLQTDISGKNNIWEIRDFTVGEGFSKDVKWLGTPCIENTFVPDKNSSIPSSEILKNIYVIVKISDNQGKEYFIRSKSMNMGYGRTF